MGMFKVRASAGRVLLKFPSVNTKPGEVIELLEEYQQRVEMAEVIDVGEPTSDEEMRHAAWLREQKDAGRPVFADFGAGTPFWKEKYPASFAWLKDIRAYRLSQPFAYAERVEEAS